MKKILPLCLLTVLLGACASAPFRSGACADGMRLRPDYFASGEKLVAFRFSASAYGYGLDGILQIKKNDGETYAVTLLASAGAYRLMRGVLSRDGMTYSFLAKEADRPAAKAKAESLLKLLLFPPSSLKNCREKDGKLLLTYRDDATVRYEYAPQRVYPDALTYKKTFGTVRLAFDGYTPYEKGELPHYLYYRDGAAEAELVLLTVKK